MVVIWWFPQIQDSEIKTAEELASIRLKIGMRGFLESVQNHNWESKVSAFFNMAAIQAFFIFRYTWLPKKTCSDSGEIGMWKAQGALDRKKYG